MSGISCLRDVADQLHHKAGSRRPHSSTSPLHTVIDVSKRGSAQQAHEVSQSLMGSVEVGVRGDA